MKTLLGISDAVTVSTGSSPVPAGASAFRASVSYVSASGAGAPFSATAFYGPSASGASLRQHAWKRLDMARIDTTGWPLGPQDRLSG